jgi:hypothetical protein
MLMSLFLRFREIESMVGVLRFVSSFYFYMGSSASKQTLDEESKHRLRAWNLSEEDMDSAVEQINTDHLELPKRLVIDTPITPLEAAVFLYAKRNRHQDFESGT